jgi:hypothetical protein
MNARYVAVLLVQFIFLPCRAGKQAEGSCFANHAAMPGKKPTNRKANKGNAMKSATDHETTIMTLEEIQERLDDGNRLLKSGHDLLADYLGHKPKEEEQ